MYQVTEKGLETRGWRHRQCNSPCFGCLNVQTTAQRLADGDMVRNGKAEPVCENVGRKGGKEQEDCVMQHHPLLRGGGEGGGSGVGRLCSLGLGVVAEAGMCLCSCVPVVLWRCVNPRGCELCVCDLEARKSEEKLC